VGSAGVTRPGRPGLDLDKQPPAVRMNDELGGLLTFKLKVLSYFDLLNSAFLTSPGFIFVRPGLDGKMEDELCGKMSCAAMETCRHLG
jgi:hypothetical protein